MDENVIISYWDVPKMNQRWSLLWGDRKWKKKKKNEEQIWSSKTQPLEAAAGTRHGPPERAAAKRTFLRRITEAGGAPRGRGEDEGAALSPTWELPKAATQAVWAAEGERRRRSRRTKRKHEDPLEEDTLNVCLKSVEVEILEIQAL